jgi:hypothetical protein
LRPCWTIRGQSPEEFKRHLASVKGLLDQPQLPQTSSQGKDFCKVHNVSMQEHTNAKGSWFSHYVDGRHCKGK